MSPRALLLPLVCMVSACALVSRSPPADIRYFTPERLETTSPPRAATGHATLLRLGRITSSANLRSHIVHRDSDFELGEYETLRWTENPEAYMRRALARALFQERPLEQGVGGPLPTLDVELIEFEEVRRGAQRGGRVVIRYQLEDERRVLRSGLVSVEREAKNSDVEPIIAAIADAMNEASSQLAGEVVTCLAQKTPSGDAESLGLRRPEDVRQ